MSDRLILHIIIERDSKGGVSVVEASTSAWKTDTAYTRACKNIDSGHTLHKAQLSLPKNTFDLLAPPAERNIIDLN